MFLEQYIHVIQITKQRIAVVQHYSLNVGLVGCHTLQCHLKLLYNGNMKLKSVWPTSCKLVNNVLNWHCYNAISVACSNTRASNRSSDIVQRIAVSVRSSLENTCSGEAVETGNVAKTFSSILMFGNGTQWQWVSASSALAGLVTDESLLF